MGNNNNNGQATGLQGKAENLRPSERQTTQNRDPADATIFDKVKVKADGRMGTAAPLGLPVSFLADLPIPSPGITVIGARTEGGKTTAMINIFRELLDAGKRVMFVTLEQRAAEIYTMLCMSKTRADYAKAHNGANPGENPPGMSEVEACTPKAGKGRSQGYTSAFISYYHQNEKTQHPIITQADNHYQKLMESGELILLDCVGMEGWSYPALQAYIKPGDDTKPPPDIVIIDYLQIMPAVENGRYTGYERIADITKEIIKIGNQRAVITGAQFNRQPGEEGKDKHGTFDPVLDRFREAADIEHAASLALGIGYWTDKETQDRKYFYKVLKSRYGGGSGARYLQSTGTPEDFRWAYAMPSDAMLSGDSVKWQKTNPADGGSPSAGKESAGGGENNQTGISNQDGRMK